MKQNAVVSFIFKLMLVGFIEAEMETWESIERSYKLKEGDKKQ